MNKALAVIGLAAATWGVIGLLGVAVARAQGFQDEPTCYSWNGGDKSSGSFGKCNPVWVVPAKKTAPPAVQTSMVATPVVPVCPPQITVIPEPKKAQPVKRKPKPLTC